MPTVASTAPPVLIAHLAAVTSRDPGRVGRRDAAQPPAARGGRAVRDAGGAAPRPHRPRHRPGAGHRPCAPPPRCAAPRTASAPRTSRAHLIDVMGLLGDAPPRGRGCGTASWPRRWPTSSPEIVLLGSSGYSAQLAGMLGLPFAFAHHFDIGVGTLRGGRALPQLVPAVAGARRAAHDRDRQRAGRRDARAGRAPRRAGRLMMLAMRTGRRLELLSPDGRGRPPRPARGRGDAVQPHRRRRRALSPNGWRSLAERTAADELMISTMTHGLPERIATLEIVADVWAGCAS